MDWSTVTDKEYHKILRHYRGYLSLIVEENAASDSRVFPLSFDEYAEKMHSKITHSKE